MSRTKIRTLIIDDSALVRQVLTNILDADPEIEVVGVAQDPIIAREKIKQLKPDVLTLDIEMPKMDGITFLRNLMRLRPMPVVMISSLTEHGADISLEALEIGAVDIISKPKIDISHGLDDYAEEICEKVKVAARARVKTYEPNEAAATILNVQPSYSADAILDAKDSRHFRTTEQLIAIGASTGGTEAIKQVLIRLPADSPGTVISQHIPEAFSKPFAERMDRCCAMKVCEATDGQQIMRGNVYIAPGNSHLLIVRDGARYVCKLNDGPPVNRHRPSVDVMFRSVAQNAGSNAIGVILTGMGNDGAHGLLEMQQAGSITIAQDEKTSVVWGMPGEAVKLGGAKYVMSLNNIPVKLNALRRKDV